MQFLCCSRPDQCYTCLRLAGFGSIRPPAAITVYPEARKIVYDPFRCIYCHQCVQNCMQGAIKPDETPRKAEYDKVVDVFEYGKAD